jgi:hypothetical protein
MIEENQEDRRASNFDQQYENPFESLLDDETTNSKMERTQEDENNDVDLDIETSYQQRDDREMNPHVDGLQSSLVGDTQTGKDDHSFTTQEDDEALRMLNYENIVANQECFGLNPFDDDEKEEEDVDCIRNKFVSSDQKLLGTEESEEVEATKLEKHVAESFLNDTSDSSDFNKMASLVGDTQTGKDDRSFTTQEDDEVLRMLNDENIVTNQESFGLNPFDDDIHDDRKNASTTTVQNFKDQHQVVDDVDDVQVSPVGKTRLGIDDHSFTTREDDEALRMLNDEDENTAEDFGISALNLFHYHDDVNDIDNNDVVDAMKSSVDLNHAHEPATGDERVNFKEQWWFPDPNNESGRMNHLNPFDDDESDEENRLSTMDTDFQGSEEESYDEKRLRAKKQLEKEIRMADELKNIELSRIRTEIANNERPDQSGDDTAFSMEADSNDTDYMSYDDGSADGMSFVHVEEETKGNEKISIASLNLAGLSQVQLLQSILLAEEASVNGDDEFRTLDRSFDDLSRVYVSRDILKEKTRTEKIKEKSKMIMDRTLTTAKMSQSHAEKHFKSLKKTIDTKITELRKTRKSSPSSQHEVEEFV